MCLVQVMGLVKVLSFGDDEIVSLPFHESHIDYDGKSFSDDESFFPYDECFTCESQSGDEFLAGLFSDGYLTHKSFFPSLS